MKTAIVTGTSYGLGKGIATMILGIGYKVYGISRTRSSITNNNFCWVKANLLDLKAINKIKDEIKEPNIDILVNNAGTHIEEAALSISSESFHHLFSLNFLAPAFLTKIFARELRGGLVINISSTSDRFTGEGAGLYCASKAAMEMFFGALAIENKNIKVIDVLPSYIDTPLQHKVNNNKDFDWGQCTTVSQVADLVRDLIMGKFDIASETKVMVLNNRTMNDTRDPEKLYYYNVDTKEFKKLK